MTRRRRNPTLVRLACEPLEPRVNPSRPLPYPVIYTGVESGAPPAIKAFDAETGALTFERVVYEPAFTGGVRVAAADLTADGFPDLIAAPGPGGGPRVRVFDGKSGEPIPGPLGSFWAFAPAFTGGVEVAAADVDGDGTPDVVVAAGPGGGPHVRVFDGRTGAVRASFFAYEPEFDGGIRVAAADFNRDGRADVAVGAGTGGGPRVRVYDVAAGQPVAGPLGDFMAYEPTFRGGVFVGTDALAGDVTGDGLADLVVGPGPGRGPQVQVYSGYHGKKVREFDAHDAAMTAGVRVGTAYVTDDARADVVTATGPGVTGRVRVFDGRTGGQIPGPVGLFTPFGPADTRGLTLGASNDPPPGNDYEFPLDRTFNWPDRFEVDTANDAMVRQTVTRADEETYRWDQSFWNTSQLDGNPHSLDDSGIGQIFFYVGDIASVTEVFAPDGWTAAEWARPDGSGTIVWEATSDAAELDVNESPVTFSFESRPRPLMRFGGMAYNWMNYPGSEETAVGGVAASPGPLELDIDIDSNRDGIVSDADEPSEDSSGTILVADKDDVYASPGFGKANDKARRREVVITTNLPPGTPVFLARSSQHVRLFRTKTPEAEGGMTELFGQNNEISILPGTYYAGGADTYSTSFGDTLLKVRENQQVAFRDSVTCTVIWVAYEAATSGDIDPFINDKSYDTETVPVQILGRRELGVHFPLKPPALGNENEGYGQIRFVGRIHPEDLNSYPTKMSQGFVPGVDVRKIVDGVLNNNDNIPASVQFGFLNRRHISHREYANGSQLVFKGDEVNDDSHRSFQDIDPDFEAADLPSRLLIVDTDHPGAVTSPPDLKFFGHVRFNAVQTAAFNFYPHQPERASERSFWSWTGDVGMGHDGRAVFVSNAPGDGTGTNEVHAGKILDDLNLNLPAPVVQGAVTSAGNKIIVRGADTTVVFSGNNLVGVPVLLGPTGLLTAPKSVTVNVSSPNNRYSDTTEMKAVFNTALAPGDGYSVYVTNSAGKSTVGGFSVQ